MTSKTVFLLTVLIVFLSSNAFAKKGNFYVYSFETTKQGKHALAIVANITHEKDCVKSVGKFKNRISKWKRNRSVKTNLVLLTVVITRETLKKCKIQVSTIVNKDEKLKTTIKNLKFDVTIVEKSSPKRLPVY